MTKVVIKVKDINDNAPTFSTLLYITEENIDAKPGDFVIQVEATDPDSGKNGLLVYSIVHGNEDGLFGIESEIGLITVKKHLAAVQQLKINMSLEVKDQGNPQRVGHSNLIVIIILPDAPPRFPVSPLVVNVKEGIPPGRLVATVRAATSALLTFNIVSGNDGGYFVMDSLYGAIISAKTLDYEQGSQYRLEITAVDSKGRGDKVTLVINLININDNTPFFPGEVKGEIVQLVEGRSIYANSFVTQIQALDLDEGDRLTYQLSAEGQNYFTIDNNGNLKGIQTVLDVKGAITFDVTVRDSAKPAHEKKAKVKLEFLHENPGQQPVYATIREDAKIGTKITTCPKFFPGGNFKIIHPQNAPFSVNNNGEVQLTGEIDFETQVMWSLAIREFESAAVGAKYLDSKLNILVSDVNDNDPVFTIVSTYGQINQNSRAGAKVLRVSSSDADSTSNGLPGYQLVPGDAPFGLNPITNQLEASANVEKKQYEMKAFPFDHGHPRRNSSLLTFNVDVASVPPKFVGMQGRVYRFKTLESTLPGAVIGTVKAISRSGERMLYFIESGNDKNKFVMEPLKGTLHLNYLLDYEKNDRQFVLTIYATELIPNPLHSRIKAYIEVLNDNDHYPTFNQMLYTASVNENYPIGSSILKVSATDCDCSADCTCALGQLYYSVQNTKDFSIDSETGVLSPAKELDYEETKWFVFKVSVTDFGQTTRNTSAFVNVSLIPVNDNAPKFANNELVFSITEDAVVGKPLAFATATDADGDPLTYTTEGNTGPFKIDPNEGLIYLSQKLPDPVVDWKYTFDVAASDGQSKAVVRLVLNIIDINDHKPEFTVCNNASISENGFAGETVTQVKAIDKDKGKNGEVEYFLAYGSNYFNINNATGVITTKYTLDREKQKRYIVAVRAEDGGHGADDYERMSSHCVFKVTILDTNDNYPEFLIHQYHASIYQKAPIGSVITVVSAYDKDDADNGQVHYTFTEKSDKFAVGKETGIVTSSIDLSQVSGYFELGVKATNRVPMSVAEGADSSVSDATVSISVTTEQPPGFSTYTYTASVREDAKIGTFVVQLKAFSLNNRKIVYEALNEHPLAKQEFSVNANTGVIVTSTTLDFEKIRNYLLQFRAVEVAGASLGLYQTCFVNVTVVDVNDHAPQFDLESYEARVMENSPKGAPIVKIEAEDVDQGDAGRVDYFISPKWSYDKFTINKITGVVRTNAVFDRENISRHYVEIGASDRGSPKLTSYTYLLVRIVDKNDQNPQFLNKEMSVSVSEDSAVGSTVYQLSAKDYDIGNNAKLNYFITKGNRQHFFSMTTVFSPKNYGAVVLTKKLDYEYDREYRLRITGADGKTSDFGYLTITVSPKEEWKLKKKSILK